MTRSKRAPDAAEHWTATDLGRRRTWASSGCLPTSIAAQLSEGERAVLSLVAHEFWTRHSCRLSIDEISTAAGVSSKTAQRAIKQAASRGLFDVEERGRYALTKVILVVDRDWTSWMAAGRWLGPADFRRGDRV